MSVQENFETFKESVVNTELFDLDEVMLVMNKEKGETYIPLQRKFMILEFIEVLKRFITLHTLCACKSMDGTHYKVVAYSMPYYDKMYIIQLVSHEHGLIDEIHVTFYPSMEKMLEQLEICLRQLKSKDVEVIEKHTLTSLYKKFM